MRDALQRIAAEFLAAKKQPLRGHPLAQFIRHEASTQARDALPAAYRTLLVTGSPGAGNWANVPWIAVFDPAITDSATRGYYVVYLFSEDMRRVYLSLNQGTTAIHEEFGSNTLEELERRAGLMRARLPERRGRFDLTSIELASKAFLPRGYEAGHACGAAYDTTSLPTQSELMADLADMVQMYLLLRSRGGVLPLQERDDEQTEEQSRTITERRQYRFHRSIERNPNASRQAKRIHGYVCQGCSFDFEEIYGPLGREYIEAHHLTPVSELPDDQPIDLDPATDFAVLCANCHRMMHRAEGPRTVDELRKILGVRDLQQWFAQRFHLVMD